jgi:hypothetical protein
VVEKTSKLREFLKHAFEGGANCEVRSCKGADQEKGPVEKGVYNAYRGDGAYGYQRSYIDSDKLRKGCYSSSSSSSDRGVDEQFPKPCKRAINSRTIMFGSLRVVDFLKDYYEATGVDPNGYGNLPGWGEGRKWGVQGEFISAIDSLTRERAANEHLGYEFNCLNLSWFHDNLVPVELCPDRSREETCKEKDRLECKKLDELACQIDRDFLQKRMLNQDIGGLSGDRLLKIAERFSIVSAELHRLAKDCDSHVRYGKEDCHVDECERRDDGKAFRFNVNLSRKHPGCDEYALVCWPYMWGVGWKYHWVAPLDCEEDQYWDICCRVDRLIANLKDLKNRTPKNCIILELIICLLDQAEALKVWVTSCRSHCCGRKAQLRRERERLEREEREREESRHHRRDRSKDRKRRHHHRKGDDVDVDAVLDGVQAE